MVYMAEQAVMLQRAARRQGWLFLTSIEGVKLKSSGLLVAETRHANGVHIEWPETGIFGEGCTLDEAKEMFTEALVVSFEVHMRAEALDKRSLEVREALRTRVESVAA